MTDVHARLTAALADRYRVERELGAGGMATVYLARDLRHDRDVALKVLKPEIGATVGAARFHREVQLAARLSHPHILPLFDSGEADGQLYYVMPAVQGRSLRDRLLDSRQLPVPEAVRIAAEVASALDHAHRQGVVHRDIKPENILLQDGHALVADFGIGKALSDVEGEAFTQTGVTVGTPAYMSPEQAAGEAVDGRSDLYSLGCVLYEMLAGEQPFTGPTVQAVIAKRFVQTPADVAALRDGVARPVARAVQQALARTPIDRFHTGADFAAALLAPEPTAHPATPRVAAPEKSVAVLPFASLSSDAENEFFADGITEEILNALAQVPELKVAGRTSSFSFKGKQQDLRQIGEALTVRTVLDGSVRRAGTRVRITAQLIDVTDGYHLWSERYDRDVSDVFAVQDEIAAAIAGRLQATFAPSPEAREQRATESIEAYECYLKGRTLLYRRGAAIKQGMALMQRALELDPTYAPAWAGVADHYSLLGYYGYISPEAARAGAAPAAAKALEFGPDLAESHSARALLALLFEWDFALAEREFLKCIELNPGYWQGAVWYHLFYQGFACADWPAALDGLKALHARDPRSGYVAACVGICFACSTPDREGLAWLDRAAESDPDAFLTVWSRQMMLGTLHDWDAYGPIADVALAMSGRQALALNDLGLALGAQGDLDGVRGVLDELRGRSRREHVPPMILAMMHAMLGERNEAVAQVRRAVATHDPLFILYAFAFPTAGALRALPEHQALLRQVGVPGAVRAAP